MASLETRSDAELDELHAFLIQTAVLLHRYGTPSHRLERVMVKVSQQLGVESVFLYTPTALIISMGTGKSEKTYLRRVNSGSIDADKLLLFDSILEQLTAGEISVAQAALQMEKVAKKPPPYSLMTTAVACGVSCASVAFIFGGSILEASVAGALGLGIAMWESVQSRLQWEEGMLFPFAGFVAAMVALVFARYVAPIDDRLVTLASVVVLLPGFTLTVALTELAVGHLSAGVARLAGASAILLTLVMGVAIAWRIGGSMRTLPETATQLPSWIQWVAIGVAPIAFSILFRVRTGQWLIVILVCLSGFFGAKWAGSTYGVEVGSFVGALIVGCGSNLYARWRDRPAMIPLAPSLIILVPGSLGYRSLTALLDRQTTEGIEFAFGMVLVAMSLVGGLLASSAVVPPKRIL